MSTLRKKSESNTIISQLQSLNGLLTSRQIADLLAIHQETVYRWVNDGLPHLRIRGRLRFDPFAIAAFLEERSA